MPPWPEIRTPPSRPPRRLALAVLQVGVAFRHCRSSEASERQLHECLPKNSQIADLGYTDAYRGWYDIQKCGTCWDYCRWVGNCGSGGDPGVRMVNDCSKWSCSLAGDTVEHIQMGERRSDWPFQKCEGEGKQAPPDHSKAWFQDQLQQLLQKHAGMAEQEIGEERIKEIHMNQEVERLRAEIDALKSQAQTLQSQVEQLKTQNYALQDKQITLSGSKSSLEAMKQNAEKEKAALEQDYSKLQKQYADPSLEHFVKSKARKIYNGTGIQDQWVPLESGFIVYGMTFIPLVCTVWCLTTFVCRLRPCLMLLHLYFALTLLCTATAAMLWKVDPMSAFASSDSDLFMISQVIFGVLFATFGALLGSAFFCSIRAAARSSATSEDQGVERKHRGLQLAIFAPVAVMYIVLVWQPAVSQQPPKIGDYLEAIVGKETWLPTPRALPYLLASAGFFWTLRLEQTLWRASGHSGGKSDDQMAVSVSQAGQLRVLPGEGQLGELASMIGMRTDEKTS